MATRKWIASPDEPEREEPTRAFTVADVEAGRSNALNRISLGDKTLEKAEDESWRDCLTRLAVDNGLSRAEIMELRAEFDRIHHIAKIDNAAEAAYVVANSAGLLVEDPELTLILRPRIAKEPSR